MWNEFEILIIYLSMISDEVAYDETWPLSVDVDWMCMSEEERER